MRTPSSCLAWIGIVAALRLASAETITVTAPNGTENGEQGWLVQAPYNITWDHAAGATGTVHIQHSTSGGTSWSELIPPATEVPVTNRLHAWTTPSTISTQARIRIVSNTNTSIWDWSDAPFTLRQGVQLAQHNGGPPTWYLGETNRIVWRRSFLASPAHLEFSATGGFTGEQQRITLTTVGTQAINTFDWVTPFTNAALLSESARLRVIQPAGAAYADTSDAPFVMAGAVMTFPAHGHPVEHGQPIELTWLSAGMGPSLQLDLQATPDAPWNPIAAAVTNATGVNHYWWTPTNAPTPSARLRLQSLSDPRAIGFSAPFELLPRVEHVVVHVSPLGAHRWPFATWEDAATNLSDAVTAAHDGSTVLVSNGTYQLTQTVIITNAITVRGVYGRELTTVNGGGSEQTFRCFTLDHPDAILEGLTIRNGFVPMDADPDSAPETYGGGVWCRAGTIRQCWLTDNGAALGGGVFLQQGLVAHCVVTNNTASVAGGGLTLAPTGAPPLIGLSAETNHVGPVVRDSVIIDNRVGTESGGGGGLAFLGGGIAERCAVIGNKALPTPHAFSPLLVLGGGAMCFVEGTLRNCVISGNESITGGGIALVTGSLIESSLVYSNLAVETAGGVAFIDYQGQIVNCIVWANDAPEGANWQVPPSVTAGIDHSCTIPEAPGSGNITNDPRVVALSAGAYTLASNSPCIDAGAPLLEVTHDFANIPRPLDGNSDGTPAWDIGPFEFLHPHADTDGDGMDDSSELTSDTDPRNAASSLRITALETNTLGVRIAWAGGTAAWQVLEYKTDLCATNEPWQPVLTVPPPTPPLNTTTDTLPTNATISYRLRALRP